MATKLSTKARKEELGKQKEKEAKSKDVKGKGPTNDVLFCVPESDVEGHNGVCDKNERRKGAHPVQNLHQPCHQPCWSGRYISKGHHSR